VRLNNFVWDEYNKEKCKKHGLTIAEIESFLLTEPFFIHDRLHSLSEDRFIAIGAVLGRYILAVFTLRVLNGSFRIRVISARYAREKEIKEIYEKEKTNEAPR